MIPLDRLSVIPVLSGVAPELRTRLAERLTEEKIPAGRLVFSEGGPGDAVYFIAEGKVSIQKTLDKARGLSKTLAVMQTGDFFGEMALLEREPRSASAIALEPTILLVLPVEDVKNWLSADARVPLRLFLPFVEALSARLRETTREMTLFFNVGRVLVQDPDSHRLGAELLDTVALAFDDPVTAGFWLWNDFSGEYEMVAGKGLWTEAHRGARSEKDPLFAWLMDKKECALSTDWPNDERFASAQTAWPSLRSLLAVPVPGDRRPIGFFVLSHEGMTNYFTPAHRRMLAGMANLVAPSFDSAFLRLEKRAQEKLNRARQDYR